MTFFLVAADAESGSENIMIAARRMTRDFLRFFFISVPPSDLDNIRILQIWRSHKKNGEEILGSGSRMEYFANTNDGVSDEYPIEAFSSLLLRMRE